MVTHEGNEQESKKLLDKAIEILTKAEEMQGEPGDAKTLETVRKAKPKWCYEIVSAVCLLTKCYRFLLSWYLGVLVAGTSIHDVDGVDRG